MNFVKFLRTYFCIENLRWLIPAFFTTSVTWHVWVMYLILYFTIISRCRLVQSTRDVRCQKYYAFQRNKLFDNFLCQSIRLKIRQKSLKINPTLTIYPILTKQFEILFITKRVQKTVTFTKFIFESLYKMTHTSTTV